MKIKTYLEQQSWYKDFVKNTIDYCQKNPAKSSHLYDILTGKYGYKTIKHAFIWETSEEGHTFWNNVNNKFEDWCIKSNMSFLEIGTVFSIKERHFIKIGDNEYLEIPYTSKKIFLSRKEKTEEEINCYLVEKPWYIKFITNRVNCLLDRGVTKNTADRLHNTLTGKHGENTISGAFIWACTPEKHDYWEKIDKEFRKWYNSSNVDDLNIGDFYQDCTGDIWVKVKNNTYIKVVNYSEPVSITIA